MKKMICFATGSIWRWAENRGELLSFIKKLHVQGVELTTGNISQFYKFRMSAKDISWLREMDRVSIHAPFRMKRDARSPKEVENILEMLEKMYQKTKATLVIIHPLDLPPLEVLSNYSMAISTENLPKNRKITIRKLKNIMAKYPEMGFCLDVGHAYSWDRFMVGKLVDAFRDRITQVHLHGCYRKKDHLSLRNVSKTYIKSLEPIRSLNVPLVIEEDMIFRNLAKLCEEVEYVHRVFGENKNFIYLH